MSEQHVDPDELILRLLAADDPHAIDLLFTVYYRRLFHAVNTLTGNAQDAADILNDLLAVVWEKRKTLVLEKPLGPYLYRAARNRTLNFQREKGRSKEISVSPQSLRGSDQLSDLQPDSALNLEDIHTVWRVAEARMTYRVRKTFVLSQHEEKSNAEIAATLGISLSAVEKNLARALKIIHAVRRSYLEIIVFMYLLPANA